MASGTNPSIAQTGVTFTASVSSTIGTPTGAVTFLDGTTPLGQGTLAAGVATLTTSSLSDGSHSITAMYNGDPNFVAVNSAALSQSVLDFSLTNGSGGGGGGGGGGGSGSVPTQTASPGGSATYPLNIIPSTGIVFPTPILLTLAGMPSGATAAIAPASWTRVTANSWTFPANTSIPAMTLTIQLAAASGKRKEGPATQALAPILWGVILLPFPFRPRSARKRLSGYLFSMGLTVAALGALSALSGCVSGNGFFGQKPSSYTVTVTATSGPLTRSTKVTLNVE